MQDAQYISAKIGEAISSLYYVKTETVFDNGGLFCNVYFNALTFARNSIVCILEIPSKIVEDFELVSYKQYFKTGIDSDFIRFFQPTIETYFIGLVDESQLKKFANKSSYFLDGFGWFLHRIFSVFLINIETKQFVQTKNRFFDRTHKKITKTLIEEGFTELVIL